MNYNNDLTTSLLSIRLCVANKLRFEFVDMMLLDIAMRSLTSFVEFIKVLIVELLIYIHSEYLVVEYMPKIVEVQWLQLLKFDILEVLLHHFVLKNNIPDYSFLAQLKQHFYQLSRILKEFDVL